jgi:hypothetical protein
MITGQGSATPFCMREVNISAMNNAYHLRCKYLICRSRIVHHINHSSTLFDCGIDPDSQDPAGHRRSQLLQHIAPRVVNSSNCFALGDILERHDIQLNPAAVHDRHASHVRRLVRLGQIYGNGSGVV